MVMEVGHLHKKMQQICMLRVLREEHLVVL
jgi:hypothetical protein